MKTDLIDHLDVSSLLWGFLSILPLQNGPSVSVQLDGGDDNIAGVYADWGSCAV